MGEFPGTILRRSQPLSKPQTQRQLFECIHVEGSWQISVCEAGLQQPHVWVAPRAVARHVADTEESGLWQTICMTRSTLQNCEQQYRVHPLGYAAERQSGPDGPTGPSADTKSDQCTYLC